MRKQYKNHNSLNQREIILSYYEECSDCDMTDFNKLLCEYFKVADEADKYFDKAVELLKKAISVQEKAIEKRNISLKILAKAEEWLDECGKEFDLGNENCECEKIEEQIRHLIKVVVLAEDCGLEEARKALKEWSKARKLNEKFAPLFNEYLKCIEEDDKCSYNYNH